MAEGRHKQHWIFKERVAIPIVKAVNSRVLISTMVHRITGKARYCHSSLPITCCSEQRKQNTSPWCLCSFALLSALKKYFAFLTHHFLSQKSKCQNTIHGHRIIRVSHDQWELERVLKGLLETAYESRSMQSKGGRNWCSTVPESCQRKTEESCLLLCMCT